MSGLMDAVGAWPIWDLTVAEWAVFGALLLVVLQHGGTAGIHAAMGRDGMIDHRRAELIGARRGTIALVVLMFPVLIIWAFDALSGPDRMELYVRANWAILAVYLPVTLLALTSFILARTTPWQVRSNMNSVVIGTLEFVRTGIAAAGMLAGVLVTRDVRVAVIGGLAVVAGALVARVTRRWWYSRPVQLADLGEPARAEGAADAA
ncbi:hypothetical protein [Demequina muriae]|uniref:Uncharacterized protein n=1 Tax=Demequina muriae TaxID=3051664 RepID=A0ABT8GDZ8_9MICO|nr:hypothetical protein [Demequina sp. EGI L300058]MDN4479653.1 hypothetical protein [Demequina sp. EGI L300058]